MIKGNHLWPIVPKDKLFQRNYLYTLGLCSSRQLCKHKDHFPLSQIWLEYHLCQKWKMAYHLFALDPLEMPSQGVLGPGHLRLLLKWFSSHRLPQWPNASAYRLAGMSNAITPLPATLAINGSHFGSHHHSGHGGAHKSQVIHLRIYNLPFWIVPAFFIR